MNWRAIGIGGFFLAALAVSPGEGHAASLFFSSPPKAVAVGQNISVNVYASSTDQSFNAAEGLITFPKNLLQVESIDFSAAATIFNFWLTLPTFSNENGTVSFSGGTTNGVRGSDVPILTLHLRAIAPGDAIITATDASINAANGNGTNILTDVHTARFLIAAGGAVIPPKPPAPAAASPSAAAPATSTAPAGTGTLCNGVFNYCTLRFPTIDSVRVERRALYFNIIARGTAPDGTYVRLVLNRHGYLYAEIEAVVQSGRSWEANFPNVYTYGSYSIDAIAETDNNRSSEPVTYSGIDLLPPYSMLLFGIVLPWYIVAALAIGAVVLALGLRYFRVYICRICFIEEPPTPVRKRHRHLLLFLLGTAIVAFLVMSTIATILYEEQNKSVLFYWPNSQIPCIYGEDSYTVLAHSATLEIFIDGKQQTIPAEIGVSPTCLAQIHTHDNSGRLHYEATDRPVTLGEVAEITGIQSWMRPGYSLAVTLNGEPYSGDIGTYPIQDGDTIVLRYTKK